MTTPATRDAEAGTVERLRERRPTIVRGQAVLRVGLGLVASRRARARLHGAPSFALAMPAAGDREVEAAARLRRTAP